MSYIQDGTPEGTQAIKEYWILDDFKIYNGDIYFCPFDSGYGYKILKMNVNEMILINTGEITS